MDGDSKTTDQDDSDQTPQQDHDENEDESENQESVYSEDDFLGPLHEDDEEAPPKRKSTVLVNRNAGFVRIRRLYEGEDTVVSRRSSMVPGFIIPLSEVEENGSSSGINTPIRTRSVASPGTAKRRVSSGNQTAAAAGSASIDPSELRIVMRALGFNLTQGEVLEITKWFEKSDDEDEALSFEEFLYVMAVKLSQKDETAEIKASFALFDVDKRGKIGMRELRKVAKELGDTLTDEDVLMMIQENDFDGDGELGEGDWAKIFAAAKS
ncbi:hypothetical protein BDR26DRAFT_866305, partial [Obelidium mucronatum]